MPYVEHLYGRTWYRKRGSARSNKLPIICLHGGPGGHSTFMEGLFELADERQVFLYDQVGGGKSSATGKRQWTVPTFVRELEILRETWGIDRFHLFGASWGTTLALEYYLKHANRVESLLFQSPMFSAKDWQDDANRLIKKLPATERKVIHYCHEIGATDSKVYRDAMKRYYAKHVCRNPKRAKLAATVKNAHGNEVYEYMWGVSEFSSTGTLKDYDRTKSLKTIKVPTLLVCGQYDEATPKTARRYSAQIPDSRFVEIKGASHAILSEKPAQLIKVVRSFLT
ncbi:MAG: proline iminopeptidase-family hydrolase [Pseudomonadales bacterium]|nr:proline iminopeptidase-family hydrolase [Pseudomonadales bacterium]MBO6565214.1 proline iminopeptidase-family hydrolase [Pseudomonadales bacterium]MBO6595162.1 proline iminopeptidase-family hydrolase [Pseudomonadales bacterium]MBO6656195.1 proline iminopeptidase-family hydrolase [Pseudomonadales bacterium]MBO6701668.1 proline iminopeptidase-family hydrolase [Pseudomonadales bacterium]